MADYGWLRVSQVAGAGGVTPVSVSALSANTGRLGRSKVITGDTDGGGGGASATCVVTQSGSAVVSFDSPRSWRYGDGGEKFLILTGVANAASLTQGMPKTLQGGSLHSLQISTDNGTTWTNITDTSAITGDPGASGRYLFRAVYDLSMAAGDNTLAHKFSMAGSGVTSAADVWLPYTKFDRDGETVSIHLTPESRHYILYGRSNSAKLTVSGNFPAMRFDMGYSVDDGATWHAMTSGTGITGDPGASGVPYMFRVSLSTSGISECSTWNLNITDNRDNLCSTVYLIC